VLRVRRPGRIHAAAAAWPGSSRGIVQHRRPVRRHLHLPSPGLRFPGIHVGATDRQELDGSACNSGDRLPSQARRTTWPVPCRSFDMTTDLSHLTQLGQSTGAPESPETATLERVPNPHVDTNYVARFTVPEFTSLCPVTGQPDFAHLVIDYVPDAWLVESKPLKLFLT